MRHLLPTVVVAAMLPFAAMAAPVQIINFAQVGNGLDVTATENAGGTGTTLTITGAAATVSAISPDSSVPAPVAVLVTLNAASIDTAVNVGTSVLQHYSGSFSVVTAVGGTNLLSGTFTDAAFGAGGGPGLVVNVNSPPDTLNLNSAAIPAKDLVPPSSLNFGFTALSTPLVITNKSIGSFGAAFVGNAAASAVAVPEPSTLAVFGTGVIGLALLARRRRRS